MDLIGIFYSMEILFIQLLWEIKIHSTSNEGAYNFHAIDLIEIFHSVGIYNLYNYYRKWKSILLPVKKGDWTFTALTSPFSQTFKYTLLVNFTLVVAIFTSSPVA